MEFLGNFRGDLRLGLVRVGRGVGGVVLLGLSAELLGVVLIPGGLVGSLLGVALVETDNTNEEGGEEGASAEGGAGDAGGEARGRSRRSLWQRQAGGMGARERGGQVAAN